MKKICMMAILALSVAGTSTAAEAKSKHHHHKKRSHSGDHVARVAPPLGYIAVTATAYNPRPSQTDSTPRLPACGHKYYIRPGVRQIAASNNLWRGKKCGDVIHISGLGNYVLADRMASRWYNKIDIVMESGRQAKQWGRRKVHVRW